MQSWHPVTGDTRGPRDPRRARFRSCIAAGTLQAGTSLDTFTSLHFVDGALHRVLTTEAGRCVVRTSPVAGQLVEEELEPELLG